MYLRNIALFVAIYGRGVLAALPDSCEEGEGSNCADCTPLASEYEPAGVGEVWYSACCTKSEEDNSSSPPVTTSKEYCYSYRLKGWPENQSHGTTPSSSSLTCGSGTVEAWTLVGQCTTNGGTGEPYAQLTDDGNGCPGQYDQSTTYEIGDTVEDNGVVYTCEVAAAFCNQNAPDLRGVGANYWKATASCTGTATPTDSPTWSTGSIQDGCPEEYDESASYEANDSVSVPRDDGISIIFTCKPFPESTRCSDATYSPMNTDNWSQAWNKVGPCEGTFTPTSTPTFDPANVGGCPEEFEAAKVDEYKPGDKVSVTPTGETYGKVYQCKAWPMGAHCAQAGYSPATMDSAWKDAWTYVSGCYGTISPTSTPTFDPANVGGCPEEYDEAAVAKYEEGDKVSVTPAGETYGKVYKCKAWPQSEHCAQAGYSPADINSKWSQAWENVAACTGTISPTSTPTFDHANIGGCPEEYEAGAEYEEGDKVSVTPTGETYGKVYQCKAWPFAGHCGQAGYSPADIDSEWSTAWTYLGGCIGTISPTASPVFQTLSAWDLGGCPEEYVPNFPYKPEDVVSMAKNADNTYGVVWKCKNAMTAPFCRNEGYAPGTQHASEAWEMVGHCSGTIAPTEAPTPYTGLCQFKYKLKTATNSEYVVLQAEDWVNGGTTISTGAGGTPLDLYKSGNLVRYGNDARKCAPFPNSGYCNQFSPFVQDVSYNPTNSPKGWSDATCGDIVSVGDMTNGDEDEFDPSTGGPVFASNGDMLVDASGNCLNGATNPEDYFKSGVEGCSEFEPSVEASLVPSLSSQPSMKASSDPSSEPSMKASSEPSLEPSTVPSVSLFPTTCDPNCVGNNACLWGNPSTVIGCGSCDGVEACKENFGDSVGNDSCIGEKACYNNFVDAIADRACVGDNACSWTSSNAASIGNDSCDGGYACYSNAATVGSRSCVGESACSQNSGATVGNEACDGVSACAVNSGDVGNEGCIGDKACLYNSGSIADGACQGDLACCGNSQDRPTGDCINGVSLTGDPCCDSNRCPETCPSV